LRAKQSLEEEVAHPEPGGRLSWRPVLEGAAAATGLVLIVVMIVQGQLIPPILAFVVLAAAGVGLLRVRERAGVIMLAVISVLFLALNFPFIVPSLSVPESSVDFLASALTVLGLVAMVVSSIALVRRRRGGAMGFVGAISALALVAVAVATVAKVAYDAAEARPGDIKMVLQDIEFRPSTISLPTSRGPTPPNASHEVSVFLDNKDTVLHTFTIEELDVDVNVPGNGSARVTFDAEPGEYEFFCVPHKPDMQGTLEVPG
jgi:hypothetical protein